jgi:hypothetical protein
MLPDITNKRFVIFGLQGSGKTELAKKVLKSVPVNTYLVYDVHHEYKGFTRYLAANRQVDRRKDNDPGIEELNAIVQHVVIDSGKIRLFVLDEANRFCPNHFPLPASILVLNDDQRHDKIAVGFVARRPAQLNTDLVELAHYIFVFRLTGRNDFQFLEDTAEGLGEAVKSLNDYEFCVVGPDRRFKVHEPLKID